MYNPGVGVGWGGGWGTPPVRSWVHWVYLCRLSVYVCLSIYVYMYFYQCQSVLIQLYFGHITQPNHSQQLNGELQNHKHCIHQFYFIIIITINFCTDILLTGIKRLGQQLDTAAWKRIPLCLVLRRLDLVSL